MQAPLRPPYPRAIRPAPSRWRAGAAKPVGNSLTVELPTLTRAVLVRIQVPQPISATCDEEPSRPDTRSPSSFLSEPHEGTVRSSAPNPSINTPTPFGGAATRLTVPAQGQTPIRAPSLHALSPHSGCAAGRSIKPRRACRPGPARSGGSWRRRTRRTLRVAAAGWCGAARCPRARA